MPMSDLRYKTPVPMKAMGLCMDTHKVLDRSVEAVQRRLHMLLNS